MVGKTKESVWEMFVKFSPHLDSLQKRSETCMDSTSDQATISANYWEKVGSNLIQLVDALDSPVKVR